MREREYLSGSNLLEIGAIFAQVGRSTRVVRMDLVRVREIVFSLVLERFAHNQLSLGSVVRYF